MSVLVLINVVVTYVYGVYLMNYESLIQKLPGVAKPIKKLTFKEKLKWTLAGLLFYFILHIDNCLT